MRTSGACYVILLSVCLSVSGPSGSGSSSDECSPLGGHFVLMEGEGQGCSRCHFMIYLQRHGIGSSPSTSFVFHMDNLYLVCGPYHPIPQVNLTCLQVDGLPMYGRQRALGVLHVRRQRIRSLADCLESPGYSYCHPFILWRIFWPSYCYTHRFIKPPCVLNSYRQMKTSINSEPIYW